VGAVISGRAPCRYDPANPRQFLHFDLRLAKHSSSFSQFSHNCNAARGQAYHANVGFVSFSVYHGRCRSAWFFPPDRRWLLPPRSAFPNKKHAIGAPLVQPCLHPPHLRIREIPILIASASQNANFTLIAEQYPVLNGSPARTDQYPYRPRAFVPAISLSDSRTITIFARRATRRPSTKHTGRITLPPGLDAGNHS